MDVQNNKYSPIPILVAVTGGAPNVITETLYGIHQSGEPMPERIIVLTTVFGREKIVEAKLLEDDGPLHQFYRDYNIPAVKLRAEDIKVAAFQGQELNDATTREEHAALADFITAEIRELTQASRATEPRAITSYPKIPKGITNKKLEDLFSKQRANMPGFKSVTKKNIKSQLHLIEHYDKYSIHASIAGGRKSMTFLLGYAMSLFGRRHDKVSHVLVDEWVEQHCRDFFYPSVHKDSRFNQRTKQEFDYSTANVMLAEMPLVLMSQYLNETLLSEHRSYSDTIELFNQQYVPPEMHFKVLKNTVTCSGVNIQLSTELMAYLWGWSFFDEPKSEQDDEVVEKILNCYLSLLTCRMHTISDEYTLLCALKNADGVCEKFVSGGRDLDKLIKIAKGGQIIDNTKVGGMLGLRNFHKEMEKLRKAFNPLLGSKLTEKYLPKTTAIDNEDKKPNATKGKSLYMLDLPNGSISYSHLPA